jgi:cob(I)alamin adenosyltransferase
MGAVDECDAAIGLALAYGLPGRLADILRTVQGRLLVVGSELMARDQTDAGSSLPRLAREDVAGLETAIDSLWETLPELRNFILAGAAELHLARGGVPAGRAEGHDAEPGRGCDAPGFPPT